jgi:SprT protein
MESIEDQSRKLTNYYIDLFNRLPSREGKPKVPHIEVSFKLRGSTAGQFEVKAKESYLIKYNKELMSQNWNVFKQRTIPHEVAHYIEYVIFNGFERTRTGRRSVHGRRWKSIMALLGVKNSTRCHSYDTSSVSTRRVQERIAYTCDCTTHMITKNMHNKILRGSIRICTKCKSRIKKC